MTCSDAHSTRESLHAAAAVKRAAGATPATTATRAGAPPGSSSQWGCSCNPPPTGLECTAKPAHRPSTAQRWGRPHPASAFLARPAPTLPLHPRSAPSARRARAAREPLAWTAHQGLFPYRPRASARAVRGGTIRHGPRQTARSYRRALGPATGGSQTACVARPTPTTPMGLQAPSSTAGACQDFPVSTRSGFRRC
jgi:hypothetical protein